MPDDTTPAAAQEPTAPAPEPQGNPPAAPETSPSAAASAATTDPLAAVIKEQADAVNPEADTIGKDGILGNVEAEDGDKKEGNPEEVKPEDKAEEHFEPFTLPDGFIEDAEMMGKFKEVAHKHGLKQEQAQELVSMYAEMEQKRQTEQAQNMAQINNGWLHEVRTHAEFGGRNLQKTTEGANAVLRRFGSPRFISEIKEMKIQNWPEMTYFLARVNKALSEDVSPAGLPGGSAEKTAAELLFPGMK